MGMLIALLLAGCGPRPSPTPIPSPGEVARRAGERMLATNSLHFVITLSGRPTYVDNARMLALQEARGDLVRPDRVRTIVRLQTLGLTSEVGIIQVGTEQYVTNPLNQRWEKMPAGFGWYIDPTLFYDPDHGIAAVLQQNEWAFTAEEETRTPAFYVLHAQVPGEQLWALTFGMITSGQVRVDFWVGREDGYVHRIRLVETESDPEQPTTWLIELSAFDQPVEIVAPPIP